MTRSEHMRSPAGGFTLLELVLVMVLICTVLAMAAPSLRTFFASRQTQDAAASIVALAGLARSQAIAEGRVYRLNLDARQGTYWLTAQQEGAFEELGTAFGRTFLLPEGTELETDVSAVSGEPVHVDFYPTGRVDTAEILLTGRKGDTALIACPSATEQFRVVALRDEGVRS
jgi:prepilin-type N-terminal cleavage/methylation domain-containing protein